MPDQIVVAGESADLDRLVADMELEYPNKRAVRLNTEGAFHTYLMVSAAQQFRAVLEQTRVLGSSRSTCCPTTRASCTRTARDAIRSRLFFQLFNPVHWVSCMNAAIDCGIDAVIEFGGGIGKGEGPDGKRPNLETIVKKSLKCARASSTIPARHQRRDASERRPSSCSEPN